MTDKLREQVSALADDELGSREAELLLERMQRDPALREAWDRYHLVGEAMRNALPAVRDAGLVERVSRAVEDEPGTVRGRTRAARIMRQLRPVAGLAVAASVAMLAVLTLQPPRDSAPGEVVPSLGERPANAPLLTPRRVDFSGVRSPELQDQLRTYLLNHSEHAGGARLRGVMPYVQIAAQDARPVHAVAEEKEPVKSEDPQD